MPPGHYYSPIPARSDVERAISLASRIESVAGIDLHADQQRNLAQNLVAYWPDVPRVRQEDWRYYPDNSMFGLADAVVYHAILRYLCPSQVIEVGSGFSSAIALDTADRHVPEIEFTFVEPFPDRLMSLLTDADRSRCQLLKQPVQEVPLRIYEKLQINDVLFIDSTHVVKAGSDVNWLVLEVLPRLNKGVAVHFHDVFWPFEYPEPWLREGRAWNENYLLQAFLSFNSTFEIMWFSSWLWQSEPNLIREHLPGLESARPGSFWLRKVV